jgi:hypothetical protein
MKLFFVILVTALALSATDPQAKQKETPKAAAKAAPEVTDASKQMAIPAEAVQDADGDYHYTDPQGKKWIYRKTPFGPARLEDTPERAAAKAAAASGAGIKATEVGDMVRFERLGPFGVWKWEKKKSELDETEKAALKNSQANNTTVTKQD